MATVGVRSQHTYASFVFNASVEELTRPPCAVYKASIHHELGKLQKKGKYIILPAALLRGMKGLHTNANAVHVVVKPGDEKV